MVHIRRAFSALSLLASLTAAGCADSSPEPKTPAAPERGLIEQLSKETLATKAHVSPKPTPVDPSFYRAFAESRGFRLGVPNHRTPTPDGTAIVFLRASKRDPRQALFEVDAASGKERVILSPDDVSKGGESLAPQEKARRERMRVVTTGFTDFELSKDGARILVSLSGKLLMVERASGKFSELSIGDAPAIDPHLSFDASEVAYVQNNDVHVISTSAKQAASAVTRGGTEDKTHGLAEFIAAEELERQRGFWWSPNGQTILFEEADSKAVEHLSLTDPGHPENPAENAAYPRPGKPNADVKLGLTRAHGNGAKTVWVDWDRAAFPYVAKLVWSKGANPLLYVLDRAQQNGRLLSIDEASGKAREILREHDDAFLNIDDSAPHVLAGGTHALWSSERDGGWRLYDLDLASGALKPLTSKEFGYRTIGSVDPAGTTAMVYASASPTENHVFALSLGATSAPPKQIDQGKWSVGGFGDQTRLSALTEATLEGWQTYPVRNSTNGQMVMMSSDVEAVPFVPSAHIESVGPDNVRVTITVPHGFDPSDKTRKYPVIDSAYGGPHASVVENRRESYIFEQVMADAAGAIVVSIDAKGTPFRGRDWERAIANKFAEVPLEGHVTALHALFATHPEMDADRVGVFGWSFGGYFAALAVLRHPEMYKVGVSGAPVADWRDYDTGYTERYLGVPPADGKSAIYDASSLLTYAAAPIDDVHPTRPLMVIHGTADDNVHFVNSLRLTGALERAHRPFVFYPLVGVTHMPIDPTLSEAMWAKITTYLSTNLQK